MQIHDELVFEIPENEVKNAVIFIKNCMETRPFDAFSVPIVAEASVGRRFGELEELDIDVGSETANAVDSAGVVEVNADG